MLKKIVIGGVGLVLLIVILAQTREDDFHYVRSGVIEASPEEIYPYISDFRTGQQWSPFAQSDPNMKVKFSGPVGEPGYRMDWEGNADAGAGHLEILRAEPNKRVEIRLTMLKPMHAENLVVYELVPEEGGTRFSWAMSGKMGFLGRVISLFINCEEMVAGQFSLGIQNLKQLIEGKKH